MISLFSKELLYADIWVNTTGGGCNKAPNVCTLRDFITVGVNVLNFMLELAFPLTVLMILWGGFKMMISRGSPDKIQEAKKTMMTAVIGLVIALCAWLIVQELLNILTPPPCWSEAKKECVPCAVGQATDARCGIRL